MRLGFAVLAFLFLAGPARADFAAGVAAYDRGDYKTAYEEWLPLARNGDPAAQRNLGHLHRTGQGVPQDFEQAARWYRRAAEAGLSGAQVNLGVMYLRGQGVADDPVEAAIWFEAAARQGHPIAQYNLGAMHLKGLGVERSEARALGWLNLAAKQGHQPALDLLSEIVQRPREGATEPGGEADDESSPGSASAPQPPAAPPAEPVQTAAAPATPSPPQSAAPAEPASDIPFSEVRGYFSRVLGFAETPARPQPERREQLSAAIVALHAGNFAVAREKLEPLAEAGDPEAQHQLGLLHARTDYAGADPVQAWAWLELAARRGNGGAAEARGRLEERLSEPQKASARRFLEERASR